MSLPTAAPPGLNPWGRWVVAPGVSPLAIHRRPSGAKPIVKGSLANQQKHGVSFKEAATVFATPLAAVFNDLA